MVILPDCVLPALLRAIPAEKITQEDLVLVVSIWTQCSPHILQSRMVKLDNRAMNTMNNKLQKTDMNIHEESTDTCAGDTDMNNAVSEEPCDQQRILEYWTYTAAETMMGIFCTESAPRDGGWISRAGIALGMRSQLQS